MRFDPGPLRPDPGEIGPPLPRRRLPIVTTKTGSAQPIASYFPPKPPLDPRTDSGPKSQAWRAEQNRKNYEGLAAALSLIPGTRPAAAGLAAAIMEGTLTGDTDAEASLMDIIKKNPYVFYDSPGFARALDLDARTRGVHDLNLLQRIDRKLGSKGYEADQPLSRNKQGQEGIVFVTKDKGHVLKMNIPESEEQAFALNAFPYFPDPGSRAMIPVEQRIITPINKKLAPDPEELEDFGRHAVPNIVTTDVTKRGIPYDDYIRLAAKGKLPPAPSADDIAQELTKRYWSEGAITSDLHEGNFAYFPELEDKFKWRGIDRGFTIYNPNPSSTEYEFMLRNRIPHAGRSTRQMPPKFEEPIDKDKFDQYIIDRQNDMLNVEPRTSGPDLWGAKTRPMFHKNEQDVHTGPRDSYDFGTSPFYAHDPGIRQMSLEAWPY